LTKPVNLVLKVSIREVMDMRKSLIVIVLMSLMFVVSGGQALASSATATATLDVSQLFGLAQTTWTLDAFSPGLNGAEAFAKSSIVVDNTGALNATAFVAGNASATGNISVGHVYSATSSANNTSYDPTNSTATASYGGLFAYNGLARQITTGLSIPYSVAYTGAASPGTTATAYAFSAVDVLFSTYSASRPTYGLNPNTGLSEKGYYTVSQIIFVATDAILANGQTGTNANSGSINLGNVALYKGDAGFFTFYAQTDTSATVPVPAAVWLLGSGLIGLAGIRRKFSE
jgi:hypothetical protein